MEVCCGYEPWENTVTGSGTFSLAGFRVGLSFVYLFARFQNLMAEAICISETSVTFNETIRCYIPEDNHLHLFICLFNGAFHKSH